MDTFIAKKGRESGRRRSTFAFIRYRLKDEARSAVTLGNLRLVDGHKIVVKRAAFGWKAREGNG